MKRIVAAAAVVVAWSAASVSAHHPFEAEYDWKRPVTVTGTISKLDWKDPHPILHITGRDDQGAEAQWTVELGRTAQLRRMGWTPTQLKAGEAITVDGWVAKDGTKRLSAKSVKISTGRELFAASSFFDVPRAAQTARTRSRETAPTTGREPAGTTGREPASKPKPTHRGY